MNVSKCILFSSFFIRYYMLSSWFHIDCARTHILIKKYMNEKQKNLEVNSLEKKPVRIHISCGKQWINEFINDRIIWNDNLLHLNFSAAPFHHSFQRVFFFIVRTKTMTHNTLIGLCFCLWFIWQRIWIWRWMKLKNLLGKIWRFSLHLFIEKINMILWMKSVKYTKFIDFNWTIMWFNPLIEIMRSCHLKVKSRTVVTLFQRLFAIL